MSKTIMDYQNAYIETLNMLKRNNNILSIFIFGSMVSGDIWEGSNIDFFVVYKEEFNEVRDIYSEVMDIPIHMKFISKEVFIECYNDASKRDKIMNSLISSKLVYSIDDEISDLYQKIIYTIDFDKGILNLVYLGNAFNEIGICKKYINRSSEYTAHELLIKALNNFSRLFLSMNGYTVSKDSLSMACNLNEKLNEKVNNVICKEANVQYIKELINYMENYLEYNIKETSKVLLDFIKNQKKTVSAYDIKVNPYFVNFKIKIEEILKVLYKNNILIKEKRELKDSKGNLIVLENVYSYNKSSESL